MITSTIKIKNLVQTRVVLKLAPFVSGLNILARHPFFRGVGRIPLGWVSGYPPLLLITSRLLFASGIMPDKPDYQTMRHGMRIPRRRRRATVIPPVDGRANLLPGQAERRETSNCQIGGVHCGWHPWLGRGWLWRWHRARRGHRDGRSMMRTILPSWPRRFRRPGPARCGRVGCAGIHCGW